MRSSDIGDQLAGWGKVAIVGTRGRVSGLPARAAVGFLEDADGSVLVAAGDPDADWALNLEAEPACTVTIGERTAAYLAAVISGAERNEAIAGLIVRYGTPSEGLGRGPVFRLRPIAGGADAHR